MDAALILIVAMRNSLAPAPALIGSGSRTSQPTLLAAYEEGKWPRRPPGTSDLIRRLMDQHGLARADLVPILGTPSRHQLQCCGN